MIPLRNYGTPTNTFAGLGISSKGTFLCHPLKQGFLIVYVGVIIFAGAKMSNTSLDSPSFRKSQ